MTDIKISFLVSVAIHSAFFLLLSILTVRSPKIYYVPVQIIGVSGSGAVTPIGSEKNISKIKTAPPETANDRVKPGDIVAAKTISKAKKKKQQKAAAEKRQIEKEQTVAAENTSTGTAVSVAGTGVGAGTGTGIGVSVESGNFPYVGYINILRNKVAENWSPAPYASGGVKKVLVYFNISRNGLVDKLAVKETSGVSYVDRSAIRAVKNSSPFPPLPPGFPDEYLGVYFMFELSGG